MEAILDFYFVTQYHAEGQMYHSRVAVFDGEENIAVKYYETEDPLEAYGMAQAFVLYWSRLYFDTPAMQPEKHDQHGWKQMRLDDKLPDNE